MSKLAHEGRGFTIYQSKVGFMLYVWEDFSGIYRCLADAITAGQSMAMMEDWS